MNHLSQNRIGALRLAVGVTIAIGAGGMARGQPIGTHYNSVEWMSADCALVLHGGVCSIVFGRIVGG
jgi:hypothetical protein